MLFISRLSTLSEISMSLAYQKADTKIILITGQNLVHSAKIVAGSFSETPVIANPALLKLQNDGNGLSIRSHKPLHSSASSSFWIARKCSPLQIDDNVDKQQTANSQGMYALPEMPSADNAKL